MGPPPPELALLIEVPAPPPACRPPQSVSGRTHEASLKKIDLILEWRQEAKIGRMDAAAPGTAAAIARGAIFCAAAPTRSGRPVIMIRPSLMDWHKFDKAAEFSAHMLAIEEAIMRAPHGGPSDFLVFVDTAGCGLRQLDVSWLKQLLSAITRGYPDRLAAAIVGPSGWIARAAFSLLSPLMPARLRSKVRPPSRFSVGGAPSVAAFNQTSAGGGAR